MTQTWLSDELIADVRRLGHLSVDDPDASDTEILAVLNRVMERRFVALIRKVRADYYIGFEDQAIVADQQDYRIPVRSTTNSVRNVVWVDTTGRERPLDPVALTDRHGYATLRGYPCGYAVQDDYLILLPKPNSSVGTLRVYFERRPSTIVLTSACQVVGDVLVGNSVAYFAVDDPTGFTDVPIDVVRGTPPFSLAVRDGTYENGFILGYHINLQSHDRAPAAGDYLCLSGETPFPQLPPEMHPLLALATAAEHLRPTDAGAAGLLMADYQDGMNEAIKLLQPRQQGKQVKVRNTSSMLRGRGYVRGGGTFSDWE